MKRIFSLCALLAMFAAAAFADVRLPDTPKPTPAPKEKKSLETHFRISLQKDAKEARLLIPKAQIKELRAQLDELDGGDSTTAAFLNFSRTQTIVGGLFLSLAFISGGVWFSRARKTGLKPNRAVVAGAVLFFGAAFAAASFANVGPPLEARSITGKIFTPAVHMYKQAWGNIKVETTDDDEIQLIVPDVPSETK
jgi:hypothetical protein